MRRKVVIFLVSGIILSCFAAYADITTRSPFYRSLIEKEIARCRLKIDLINSRGENLRVYGRKVAAQMVFYQHSKQQLIRNMVEESVGVQHDKVNYFLIKAFNSGGPMSQLAISQNRSP
jgi:hypothetical protein